MKCIDAIEGVAKSILLQWYGVCVENQLEDSEYVRNVKAVIEATNQYLADNPEVVESPQLLAEVLYGFSRDLWMSGQQGDDKEDIVKTKDMEYQTYYYDYLYQRGIYPR